MGHDHYYYHTIRDGIHYVTTAGGGAPLAGIDPDPPTWQEGDIAYSVYHYCHVEVNRTHITVTALTPDDTALESFAIARTRDTTPPNITGVSQIPLENDVQPDDEVIVNATVIDVVGGVERVALNYTNGNGTWVIIEMTSLSVHQNVWSAIIPSFPYGTNVTYIVIAEDDAGNTITSEKLGYECQYQVIPEFTSFLIQSLLMIVTLLAVIVYAKKRKRNLKIIS